MRLLEGRIGRMAQRKQKLTTEYPRGRRWWLRYWDPITGNLVRVPTGLRVGEDDDALVRLRMKYDNYLLDGLDPKAELARQDQG